MHFLMVVISKMAHKVDLRLTERQISQSLNSRMLHQESAVCALTMSRELRRGAVLVLNILSPCVFPAPNGADQFNVGQI